MSEKPPVIFLAFANDPDDHLKKLKDESSELDKILDPLQGPGSLTLRREESATVEEIADKFTNYLDQIAIFHYGGHANSSELRLEGKSGHVEGLATMLGELKNLQLVFLNGCCSYGHVEILFKYGVKAVIATSVNVGDETAKKFSAQFYQAIAKGQSIITAFSLAEGMLITDPDKKSKFRDRKPKQVRGFHYRKKREETGKIPWGLYTNPNFEKEDVLDWRLAIKQTIPVSSSQNEPVGKDKIYICDRIKQDGEFEEIF